MSSARLENEIASIAHRVSVTLPSVSKSSGSSSKKLRRALLFLLPQPPFSSLSAERNRRLESLRRETESVSSGLSTLEKVVEGGVEGGGTKLPPLWERPLEVWAGTRTPQGERGQGF